MNTKFFPKSKIWFYFLNYEKKGSFVFFIFPGVWVDVKSKGLEAIIYTVTFAFLNMRFHINIGKLTPQPSLPLSDEFYGIGDFIRWASNWSKRAWIRSKFDKWLLESDWKNLVKWGGAKYHYSRIILAKEFLTYENNLEIKSQNNDDVSNLDDLNLNIDFDLNNNLDQNK